MDSSFFEEARRVSSQVRSELARNGAEIGPDGRLLINTADQIQAAWAAIEKARKRGDQ